MAVHEDVSRRAVQPLERDPPPSRGAKHQVALHHRTVAVVVGANHRTLRVVIRHIVTHDVARAVA